MNIKSPNGEWFGFGESILNTGSFQEDTSNQSSTKATYTGWGSTDEEMTFANPISGKWYIEIRHDGGVGPSTFSIKSNYLMYSEEPTITTETIKAEPTLKLQVGANEGNTFSIDLTDARTASLGIVDLNVLSHGNANHAITLIDKAIQLVSSDRTKYGAYQNALEHIGNNVSNYKMNLTASESQVRDLDMSKEITELTKNQVILQASQAMSAQANQITHSILQLLK
ncbi:flagellin [Sporosarcina sp. JAI121]|uniref:flagellin n=1 Tax=Sporosarcina sp. JAI121 TaxID=2723064 RepID=UPI0015C77946|nr:flagellin [Sporosarcina sp. JAI121]NYF23931.1 flagellin-like hook-associated protein FlgL [Sporosarcina sp. JAI121]